jgi:hypothetical protein
MIFCVAVQFLGEMRRKMALCCWRKMAKNGAFQKKFERKKLAKNGTFETKNRLSPSPHGPFNYPGF